MIDRLGADACIPLGDIALCRALADSTEALSREPCAQIPFVPRPLYLYRLTNDLNASSVSALT